MKRSTITFLLSSIVLLACSCTEDVPSREEDEFVKIYGGSGNETGHDILPLEDGSVLMLGSSTSTDTAGERNNQSIYLVWADQKGAVTNSVTFPSENNETGKALLKTSDGYLVIAESGERFSSTNNIRIIRVDESGDILNDEIVGFTSFDDQIESAIMLPDGGYLIAGTTENVDLKEGSNPANDLTDILLIRMSASDEVVWTERYGFGGVDRGQDVLLDNNDNIVLAGTTDFEQEGREGDNLVLYRINNTGLETAVRIYGSDSNEAVSRIYQRQNQFYLIGSIGTAARRESAIWRIGATLDSLEVLTFSVSRNERGVDMAFLNDGSYAVVSNASFAGSSTDFSYVQVDAEGNSLPLATYGANGNDQATSIFKGYDGKISLFGTIYFENRFKMSWIKPGVSTVSSD